MMRFEIFVVVVLLAVVTSCTRRQPVDDVVFPDEMSSLLNAAPASSVRSRRFYSRVPPRQQHVDESSPVESSPVESSPGQSDDVDLTNFNASDVSKILNEELKLVARNTESLCGDSASTFCEDPSEYPFELVSALVARLETDGLDLHMTGGGGGADTPTLRSNAADILAEQEEADRRSTTEPYNRPVHCGVVGALPVISLSTSQLAGVIRQEQEILTVLYGVRSRWSSTPAPQAPSGRRTPLRSKTAPKVAPAGAGSDFVVETPMCAASQHYTYPKRAENQNNKYRFIINLPEKDIVQAVRIETCMNSGGECGLGGGLSFSDLGVRTVCRQKYTFHKLLAVNETGHQEMDYFRFPTCCLCHYVEETRFASARFNPDD